MARKFKSSGNPFMKEEAFRQSSQEMLQGDITAVRGERMTVSGAVNKSFILKIRIIADA